jgi:hypothetical protein
VEEELEEVKQALPIVLEVEVDKFLTTHLFLCLLAHIL